MKNLAVALSIIFLLFNEMSGQSSQKFTVGLSMAPNYSSRLIQETVSDLPDPFADSESGKLGWSLGLTIGHQLARSLYLRFGAQVSSLGYRMPKEELRFGNCSDGMGGFDPDCDDWFKFRNDFLFFDLPVELRYFLSENGIFLQSGLNLSYFISGKTYGKLSINGSTNENASGIEFRPGEDPRFFLGFNLGFGKQWQNERFGNISLRPSFRYLPKPLKLYEGPERSLWAASLFFEWDF